MIDKLPQVPKDYDPRGNLRTIPGEIDVPGPVIRNKRAIPDNFSEPVKSKKEKEEKAKELKNRLKTLSIQLYGKEIEEQAEKYAEETAKHELSHATAINKKVSFGLAIKKGDLYPIVTPVEKLNPWERKRMAEAPGKSMSTEDKAHAERAQTQINKIRRTLLISSIIVGTPVCGALIYLATH